MMQKNVTAGEDVNPATVDCDPESNNFAQELYPELRRIAAARMRRERSDHTLQPTALVGELWIELLKTPDVRWHDRKHFLLAASQAMHRLLVDHARARKALKRGGRWKKEADHELDRLCGGKSPEEVLAMDEVLDQLRRKEPRMASVVELKFFGGLTFREIGAVVGVDERTAKRDWTLARAWLRGKFGGKENDDSGGIGED